MREKQRESDWEEGSSQTGRERRDRGTSILLPLSPWGTTSAFFTLHPCGVTPTWQPWVLVPAALPSTYLPPTEKSETA